MITAQQIKELREKTGAGVADVKKALEDAKGDADRALAFIQRKFGDIMEKKAGRRTSAGIVEAYIHSNGRIGVLLELLCETDFVARTSGFRELAHSVCLHIAAMRPLYASLDVVPPDVWDAEKRRFEEEAAALGKPTHIAEEIVDGKLKSYFGALALMEQQFVKDQDRTVGQVLRDAVGQFGENIRIGKFVRFEI